MPPRPKTPEQWRSVLPTLKAKAANLRNPATASQPLTRRRATIIDSMRQRAERIERLHDTIMMLADDLENGVDIGLLARVRSAKALEILLQFDEWPKHAYYYPERTALRTSGIDEQAFDEARCTALALAQAAGQVNGSLRLKAESDRLQSAAAMERELIGTRIPGFFPTPRGVIARMIVKAEGHLKPGAVVLDPSAGKGDMLDMVRAYSDLHELNLSIYGVEINADLQAICAAKGHVVRHGDILSPGSAPDGADVILMNPPFEKEQDAAHIRRCCELLRPGGLLVALCSFGLFQRQNATCREFRTWLDEQDASVESLPPESFRGAAAFRQTSVSAKLIVLRAAAEPASEDSGPKILEANANAAAVR